jgi:hypothetical protein
LKASGRLGSYLPFSMALTVCRETPSRSAKIGETFELKIEEVFQPNEDLETKALASSSRTKLR